MQEDYMKCILLALDRNTNKIRVSHMARHHQKAKSLQDDLFAHPWMDGWMGLSFYSTNRAIKPEISRSQRTCSVPVTHQNHINACKKKKECETMACIDIIYIWLKEKTQTFMFQRYARNHTHPELVVVHPSTSKKPLFINPEMDNHGRAACCTYYLLLALLNKCHNDTACFAKLSSCLCAGSCSHSRSVPSLSPTKNFLICFMTPLGVK